MGVAPVFFIGHGAPTFAIEPGVLGPQLTILGKQLSGITAVLVVSPHWQSNGVHVMTTMIPETMHDFGGFDPALYKLKYPVIGHPQYATEAGQMLARAGLEVSFDNRRGLDHGAWIPLMRLLPEANVPVFQVSMPVTLNTADALRMGQALAPMRNLGVLIVGSGNLTHNLYEFRQSGAPEVDYPAEFTNWVREAVKTNEVDRLVNYRSQAPHAERAQPTEEHYLPLLVAIGAASIKDETAQVIEGGITHGVLSMESYVWGMTDES
ncbi:MAG: class III extradiol ring-cleavage dioxygenase [Methylotenera sp.]